MVIPIMGYEVLTGTVLVNAVEYPRKLKGSGTYVIKQLILIAVLIGTAAGASAQEKKPVIDENFASLESKTWWVDMTAPLSGIQGGVGVVADGRGNGELTIINRVYGFTKREFPKGGRFLLKWSYVSNGSRPYADNFLFLMRTTGAVNEARPWDTQDGLRVMIDPGHGVVHLDHVVAGKGSVIAEAFITGDGKKITVVDKKPEGPEVALAPRKVTLGDKKQITAVENVYTIEVTDKDGKISVSIGGVEVFKGVEYDSSEFTEAHVGFGNREYPAKKSHLAHFTAYEHE